LVVGVVVEKLMLATLLDAVEAVQVDLEQVLGYL
jgi:hypothetical protein